MPDYSHLVGRAVRIPAKRPADVIAGRLESCRVTGPRTILAVIRRGPYSVLFVGGSFTLEALRDA